MSERSAEKVTSLRRSLEDTYCENGAETASTIYFELARLAVDKITPLIVEPRELYGVLTPQDQLDAVLEAEAFLTYRTGCRAAYADFSAGNDVELQKLIAIVNERG